MQLAGIGTGGRIGWLMRAAAIAAVSGSLLFGSPAFAQDEAPAEDAPVEVPAVVTEPLAPPPPTEAPPPPPTEAPQPTQAPEPTIAPTEPPIATDAPTEPATAEPTSIPASPTIAEPTESPTETPTETPAAILTYDLVDEPDCTLAPDQNPAIVSGGSLEYTCVDTVALRGSQVVPAEVAVTWHIRADVAGGWSVQLLSPTNDPTEVVEWSPMGASEAHFDFDQRDPAGTAAEASDLDGTARIEFRLRVHRAACALEPEVIQLNHDVTVRYPDMTIDQQPALTAPREPLRITPELAAIPDPVISFDGALNFGEVGVSAQGPSDAVKRGTLAAVVSNLDQACGVWTVRVSATTLTDAAGLPLEGARLVVVSIDNEFLPDGGCDLANGCDLVALAGGPDAPSIQTLTLGVELRMPEQPGLGAFSTTLAADLRSADASDSTRSPEVTSGEGSEREE